MKFESDCPTCHVSIMITNYNYILIDKLINSLKTSSANNKICICYSIALLASFLYRNAYEVCVEGYLTGLLSPQLTKVKFCTNLALL